MELLVIEDDPVIGKSLRKGLIEAGHGCVWAKEGECANGLSGTSPTHRAHRRDVDLVRVRQEQVPRRKAILLDQMKNGRGVPARIEQRRLARTLVPKQLSVAGYAVGGGGDLPQLAPLRKIGQRGPPAFGQCVRACRRSGREHLAKGLENSPAPQPVPFPPVR